MPELFVAVKVMACAPAVPAAGVPLSVPVPLPLSVNVTPPGNAVAVIEAAGVPTVVTVKVPRLPTVNAVLVALVNPGASLIVSVNVCTAAGSVPLLAVKVMAYGPAVPGSGVPPSVPVPFPLSTHVIPAGSVAPVRVIVGTGKPVVVTANVPGAPTGKVVAAALVIAGAVVTVSVKVCVAGVAPPLSARERQRHTCRRCRRRACRRAWRCRRRCR